MKNQGDLTGWRCFIILVLVSFIVLATTTTLNAQPKWGLGAKVIGPIPFVTGSVEWSNIKLGLGAHYTTQNDVEMTIVSVDGKYRFFNRRNSLRPYIGLKGVSINAESGIYSAMISGGGATAGISWLATPFLNLEIGAVYLNFTEVTVGSLTVPTDVGGSIFEAGVTWRF